MNLYEMIFRRKSCRSFTGKPVADELLAAIQGFDMKPLYPEIRVHWEIAIREQVKCLCPWTTPQLITIYSEKKDGYLENVGFLFQQMDLYLQSLCLGVCWLGMGKLDSQSAQSIDGMEFVIMLAFGYPEKEALRKEITQFRRKPLSKISDREDPRLEPARLAPSSVNSQPWYFVHEDDMLHVYCVCKGLVRSMPTEMNRIDIGIALAHLYIADPCNFCFIKLQPDSERKGYSYIGSIVKKTEG